MTSMLALVGGILGMFVLFGVAWKLIQPEPTWEFVEDEGGLVGEPWRADSIPRDSVPVASSSPRPTTVPTVPPTWVPIAQAQSTVAYSVPPAPAVPAWPQWSESKPSKRPPSATRPPPPPPRPPAPPPPPLADDLEGVATQFFVRAMLAEIETKMDRTQILADEHVVELGSTSVPTPKRKSQFYSK